MDYGMATKKGAQALETGRRKQRLNTMQKLAKKRHDNLKQAKKSHLLKPDSSGDSRVKAAEKEYDAVLKELKKAKNLAKKVPFEKRHWDSHIHDSLNDLFGTNLPRIKF